MHSRANPRGRHTKAPFRSQKTHGVCVHWIIFTSTIRNFSDLSVPTENRPGIRFCWCRNHSQILQTFLLNIFSFLVRALQHGFRKRCSYGRLTRYTFQAQEQCSFKIFFFFFDEGYQNWSSLRRCSKIKKKTMDQAAEKHVHKERERVEIWNQKSLTVI